MERINVSLDAETLSTLATIAERFGITDRSSAIRFAARYLARKEHLMQIPMTPCVVFHYGVVDPQALDINDQLEAAGIEIQAATHDLFAVDALAVAPVRKIVADSGSAPLDESFALVCLVSDWDGPYPVNAFTDDSGEGLIIPLELHEEDEDGEWAR